MGNRNSRHDNVCPVCQNTWIAIDYINPTISAEPTFLCKNGHKWKVLPKHLRSSLVLEQR